MNGGEIGSSSDSPASLGLQLSKTRVFISSVLEANASARDILSPCWGGRTGEESEHPPSAPPISSLWFPGGCSKASMRKGFPVIKGR